MNIQTFFGAFATAFLVTNMSGCVTFSGDQSTYRIGQGVTRTTPDGNSEKLTSEGWKSTTVPEAAIPRLVQWHVLLQDSGFKAWKYAFESDKNYKYIDPYAPIVEAATLSANGTVTYLVRGNKLDSQEYIVKRVNFTNKDAMPETLGILEGVRREWRFTPKGATEAIAGYGYHLTAGGILIFRSANVFSYFPSTTVKARILPDGWYFAVFQKGDLETSRLLMVKKANPKFLDPGRELIGFYDVDKSQLLDTQLDMSFIEGSEEIQFKNRFYLYDTSRGPIAVALEDGLKKVVVRNLKTGQSRVAFERASGIARLKSQQTNTGRIYVKAEVGFSDEELFDAEDFLYNDQRQAPLK